MEAPSIENFENMISKRMVNENMYPEIDEYILNGASYQLIGGKYKVRDEPLFMFKKTSRFRIWAENILKECGLDDEYTLLYITSEEWYNSLTLIKKNIYKF